MSLVLEALRHLWWDVIMDGRSAWMDRNNGYMFVAIYLSCVSVLVSLMALRHT